MVPEDIHDTEILAVYPDLEKEGSEIQSKEADSQWTVRRCTGYRNLDWKEDLRDQGNNFNGQIIRTGVYLSNLGIAGSLQQIDIAV